MPRKHSFLLFISAFAFTCFGQKHLDVNEYCVPHKDLIKPTVCSKPESKYLLEVRAGVHGGSFINNFKLNGESYISKGHSGGGYLLIPMSARWSLRPELNLQLRRALYSTDIQPFGQIRTSHKYLDIPILFQRKFQTGFSYFLGPQFGKGVGASYKNVHRQKIDLINEENPLFSDQTSNTKEFSVVAGGSYMFDFGLGVDLKYQRSMANFYDGHYIHGMRYSMLQFGLDYMLPKKNN